VVKGAVVKLTVPVVVQDMFQAEFVAEAEDTVGTRFRGIKVILGVFEWGEFFKGEVFREVFNGEVRNTVEHSVGIWSLVRRVLIHVGGIAD